MNWAEIYEHNPEAEIEASIKSLYEAKNWEELHRAQWSWLSLDSERSEYEWFKIFNIPKVRNYCFACKAAEEAYSCLPKWEAEEIADFDEYRPAFCPCCPITDSAEDECMAGLYGDWVETYLEEREEAAWQIASVEWK